jgi:hypothetical protein
LESGIRNLESAPPPASRQGLKSEISDFKSPGPKSKDPAARRYYNDAVEGLKLLYESALDGHPGAKEELRAEAERLLQRGARWRDATHAAKK